MQDKIKINWPDSEKETNDTNKKEYQILVDATVDLTQKSYTGTANRSHDRK